MTQGSDFHPVDRRTFVKAAAIGAAAAAIGARAETAAQEPPRGARRKLGRTGLELSAIGIGTFRTTEPAVMRVAFEQGVNYLDTARTYHGGNNEAYVCEAIKGWRDKLYISTKTVLASKEAMTKSIDTSLSKLGTDYVDILCMHHLSSKDEVLNEDARDVLAKAREQGKARFLGISTHRKEVEVLDTMIEDPDKLYDVAIVVYNFKSGQEITDAIARAAKAGIGIVAMKTQAGGYKTKDLGDISPHQAALKWVLENPNVTTTVPSMVNLDQIKENVAVMHVDLKLSRAESQVLERYGRAIAPYYCHRCGACEPTCPYGVDIPTINRCLMYAEGYGDVAVARATHAELPWAVSAAACAGCATCVAQCAQGLSIPDQMRRAQALFA